MTVFTGTTRSTPLNTAAHAALMFPTLSSAQIARIASRGVIRPITRGEVLIEGGQTNVPFFVVKAGEIEVVRPSGLGDLLVAVVHADQFTGDISMILGRPALMRLRVSESGEVVELTRDQMHALIQADTEMSEVLMKALIYRRIELVAQEIGDVLLIGSAHSAATLRIKAFLTRNGHPFRYLDLDRDADVRDLLDRFRVDPAEIPVLICRGEVLLKNPSSQEIANCLGFNGRIDQVHLRDVVIVGAGPAGLAAAVYAASEGLDALVLEANSPGGQAGSSSRIENYLGFPTGISGQELAERAYAQAQKFGADVMIAKSAAELTCERRPYGVRLDDGATIPARTVIIAAGARYRKPSLANLGQFEGVGVYYNATFMEEAQLGDGDDVIVVGGANSAGQAAVFLAQTGRPVHVLVRANSLSESMSRYLLRRIEETPTIHIRTRTEIVALEGNGHLERVQWRDDTGAVSSHDIKHVFLMTGAEANTGWLKSRVTLDEKGFIKTGPDLMQDDLGAAEWPLKRAPFLLETSLPGVFAVGDARCGNIKRVASAVGEGSIAISYVHRVLAEQSNSDHATSREVSASDELRDESDGHASSTRLTGPRAMSNTEIVFTPAAAQTIRPPVQWRSVAAFSALAYALSWGWWAPMVWPHLSGITLAGPLPNLVEGGSVRVPLGMFGPLIAAMIMRLFVTRDGLKGTLGAIRPWRYYVVGIAAPAFFVASIICVDHVTGLGHFAPSRPLGLAIPTVVIVGGALSLPLTIGEEYGWRGYLLPRLLPLGEVRATLIVAVIWALWHVPILLIGLNYPNQSLMTVLPVFAVAVILTAFPFTWLYVQSRSSVMVVAVMHGVLNATGDTFTSSKYLQGNPLVVSAGGLVAGGILLMVIVAYGAHRYAGTGTRSIPQCERTIQ